MATPKKKPHELKKRGRKPKPLKFDAGQVEELAAIGLTLHEIGQVTDMCRSTLWKRIKASPELRDAIEKGRARLHASIRRSLYDEGVNKRNVTALIWMSKNELGWADRAEHRLTGHDGEAVKVKHTHGLTDDMAEAVKRKIFGMTEEE